MKLTILFKEYLYQLLPCSNHPASVRLLLGPFEILDAPKALDPHLLVGHVLDALAEEFLEAESMDVLDVLRVMEDLGSDLSIQEQTFESAVA